MDAWHLLSSFKWDDKIYIMVHRARCTTTTIPDTDKSKKSDRPRPTMCNFDEFWGKWKVHHHFSTPGVSETLCLLFRHVAANLAYYPGTTLVSALSHLCRLHDCHDLGRQEYYMATWKEANTWTQFNARLSHNTGLFSASIHKPPFSLSYGAYKGFKWLGIVHAGWWSTARNI